MIHVKPSEARRRWFELLDEVIAGQPVVMERNGHRIVIRAEDLRPGDAAIPDYSDVIGSPNLDEADRWGWDWDPDKGLIEVELPPNE